MRNVAAVLTDFFEKSANDEKSRLLNTRVIPAADWSVARERLLSGSRLQEDALVRLAAFVFLDGTFNINSTRKEAWKAVLSSARGAARSGGNGATIQKDDLTPVGSCGHLAAGMAAPMAQASELEQWSGFRALKDNQIDALATAMVQEVKTRGPFLSMADFLNRRLTGSGDQQSMGAVQSAIETAGLNDPLKSGSRALRPADFGTLPGAAVAGAVVALSSTGAGSLSSASVVTGAAGTATVKLVAGASDLGAAVVTATSNAKSGSATVEFGATDASVDLIGKRVYVTTEFAAGKRVTIYDNGVRRYSAIQTSDAEKVVMWNVKAGSHTIVVKISGASSDSVTFLVK